MPVNLAHALEEMLNGWMLDLDPDWRNVLAGVELGFNNVDPDLQLRLDEPIFPARKGVQQLGAPRGAHMFRAFDELGPGDVRCILLGQDPYPCMAFSTGRAFDIGNYNAWRDLSSMFTHSMRSMTQCVCAERVAQPELARTTTEWPRVLRMIESGEVRLEKPPELAQTWVDQGVLLLNASLTISRFEVQGDPHQTRGHGPLWRPFMVKLLQQLMADCSDPPPIVLFGDAAKATFDAAFPDRSAIISDCIVETEHPAAGDTFLAMGNPLSACNKVLNSRRATAVRW